MLYRLCLVALFGLTAADAPPSPGTPAGVDDLRRLEARVQATASAASRSTVAVRSKARKPGGDPVDGLLGSGVIISADGLILSQHHVTHAVHARGRAPGQRAVGDRLVVVLSDDREVAAEVLGADPSYDVSLLRIVSAEDRPAGDWPHAGRADSTRTRLGDWAIKLGHPAPGRPAVVRLGRLLDVRPEVIACDGLIQGGDSGGPLFDLDGRILGIIRSSGWANGPIVAPPGAFVRYGSSLTAYTPADVCWGLLDRMRAGEIVSTSRELGPPTKVLPADEWTHGPAVAAAFRDVVHPLRSTVAVVECFGRQVAFGTVVDRDGLLLTKASELTGPATCRLADGRVLPAEVVGADPAFDLALLKVAADNLTPVDWAPPGVLPVGSLVATPGAGDGPVAMGVISVAAYSNPGTYPDIVRRVPRLRASPLEVIGSPVPGRGYWVEHVEGNAAEAGIRAGDLIVTVAGQPVHSHDEFAASVGPLFAGDEAPVRIKRAGEELALTVRLRSSQPGRVSDRQSFPEVFEHASPLLVTECGGPLVDLEGQALGINVARNGTYGSMAVPAEAIRRLLPELRAGAGADRWEATAAPPTRPVPPPHGLSVADVRQRLKERQQAIASLDVEYREEGEALVAPDLVAAWQLSNVRDYVEERRVAFSGDKRYTRVNTPTFRPRLGATDRLVPDAAAPAELRASIEREAHAARQARLDGLLTHLFAPGGENQVTLFDGKKTHRYDPLARRFGAGPPDQYSSPKSYLAGLGLALPDPAATSTAGWLPDSLDSYATVEVLPESETIDGQPCVVLRASQPNRPNGTIAETHWLDLAHGFVPRRRELDLGDGRHYRWDFSRFSEESPGVWLPLEGAVTAPAPTWAAAEYANKPAFRTRLTVRRLRMNGVPDDLFEPRVPDQ